MFSFVANAYLAVAAFISNWSRKPAMDAEDVILAVIVIFIILLLLMCFCCKKRALKTSTKQFEREQRQCRNRLAMTQNEMKVSKDRQDVLEEEFKDSQIQVGRLETALADERRRYDHLNTRKKEREEVLTKTRNEAEDRLRHAHEVHRKDVSYLSEQRDHLRKREQELMQQINDLHLHLQRNTESSPRTPTQSDPHRSSSLGENKEVYEQLKSSRDQLTQSQAQLAIQAQRMSEMMKMNAVLEADLSARNNEVGTLKLNLQKEKEAVQTARLDARTELDAEREKGFARVAEERQAYKGLEERSGVWYKKFRALEAEMEGTKKIQEEMEHSLRRYEQMVNQYNDDGVAKDKEIEQANKERDEAIKERDEMVKKRDETIKARDVSVKDKIKEIVRKNEVIKEKDETIKKQEEEIKKMNEAIKERETLKQEGATNLEQGQAVQTGSAAHQEDLEAIKAENEKLKLEVARLGKQKDQPQDQQGWANKCADLETKLNEQTAKTEEQKALVDKAKGFLMSQKKKIGELEAQQAELVSLKAQQTELVSLKAAYDALDQSAKTMQADKKQLEYRIDGLETVNAGLIDRVNDLEDQLGIDDSSESGSGEHKQGDQVGENPSSTISTLSSEEAEQLLGLVETPKRGTPEPIGEKSETSNDQGTSGIPDPPTQPPAASMPAMLEKQKGKQPIYDPPSPESGAAKPKDVQQKKPEASQETKPQVGPQQGSLEFDKSEVETGDLRHEAPKAVMEKMNTAVPRSRSGPKPQATTPKTSGPPVITTAPEPPVAPAVPGPPVTTTTTTFEPPVATAALKPPDTAAAPGPSVTAALPEPSVTAAAPKPPITAAAPNPPATIAAPESSVTAAAPRMPSIPFILNPPVSNTAPKPPTPKAETSGVSFTDTTNPQPNPFSKPNAPKPPAPKANTSGVDFSNPTKTSSNPFLKFMDPKLNRGSDASRPAESVLQSPTTNQPGGLAMGGADPSTKTPFNLFPAQPAAQASSPSASMPPPPRPQQQTTPAPFGINPPVQPQDYEMMEDVESYAPPANVPLTPTPQTPRPQIPGLTLDDPQDTIMEDDDGLDSLFEESPPAAAGFVSTKDSIYGSAEGSASGKSTKDNANIVDDDESWLDPDLVAITQKYNAAGKTSSSNTAGPSQAAQSSGAALYNPEAVPYDPEQGFEASRHANTNIPRWDSNMIDPDLLDPEEMRKKQKQQPKPTYREKAEDEIDWDVD